MAPDTAAPTGSTRAVSGNGVTPWAVFAQQARETVSELQWPRDAQTYERVLTDAQVWGLYSGTVGPIENYDWYVDPNGNDETLTAALAEDLGLPVGEPDPNAIENTSLPGEFDFHDMLHEALLGPVFGRYFFEWSGEVRDGLWRIQSLAPIHPTTMQHIESDETGQLQWIRQNVGRFTNQNGTLFAGQAPKIQANSLVPFVFWPDATRRWTGRSLLRPLYRNWLVKDILIRTDVANHEKAGGIPVMTTDEHYQGLSLAELSQMAQEMRLEQDGGGATPPGVTPVLLRGGATDIVGSMRYNDEQMAFVWASMVRQLGSTANGSRALGDVQVDLEAMARRSIAEWARKTLNRWVLARWWIWNTGQRNAPVLRFRGSDLETDDPAADEPGGDAPNPPVAAASRQRSRRVAAAASDPPPRSRKPVGGRDLTEMEVRAAVDFQALEAELDTVGDDLARYFTETVLPEHLEAVDEAITFTRTGTERVRITADAMAKIEVPVVGSDAIADKLLTAAVQGAIQAHAELAAQGLDVPLPTVEDLRPLADDQAKAIARLWANGTQLSASQRAVRMSRAGLDAAGLAADVRGYSEGLVHDWEKKQAQGAVQAALSGGRSTVWEGIPGAEAVTYVGSAVLDGRTCGPCAADDGREFATLAEALVVFPAGNARCEGGARCRCQVVVVAPTGQTLLSV